MISSKLVLVEGKISRTSGLFFNKCLNIHNIHNGPYIMVEADFPHYSIMNVIKYVRHHHLQAGIVANDLGLIS